MSVASTSGSAPVVCGYLYKQREVIKSWRVRWVVLSNSILTYFEDAATKKPRASLYLAPGTLIKPLDPKSFKRPNLATDATSSTPRTSSITSVADAFASDDAASPGTPTAASTAAGTQLTPDMLAAIAAVASGRDGAAPGGLTPAVVHINTCVGPHFAPFAIKHPLSPKVYVFAVSGGPQELAMWMDAMHAATGVRAPSTVPMRGLTYSMSQPSNLPSTPRQGAGGAGAGAAPDRSAPILLAPPTKLPASSALVHVDVVPSRAAPLVEVQQASGEASAGSSAAAASAPPASGAVALPVAEQRMPVPPPADLPAATRDALPPALPPAAAPPPPAAAAPPPPVAPPSPPRPVLREFVPAPLPPAPYDEKVKAGLRRLVQCASEVDGLWRPTSVKDGITCYVALDDKPAARGDGLIPFPRAAIADLLMQIERKGETDSQFDKGHNVTRWDAHSTVTYMLFKGMFLVSPRDFCNLTHWRVDEDGVLYILATSIEHAGAPEVSGAVRAQLEIGGWVIRPLPGAAVLRAKFGADIAAGRRPPPYADPELDSQGCECTYLMRSDFKGSLPTSATRAVAAQQAMLVGKVREVLTAKYGPKAVNGAAALAALCAQPILNEGDAEAWQTKQRAAASSTSASVSTALRSAVGASAAIAAAAADAAPGVVSTPSSHAAVGLSTPPRASASASPTSTPSSAVRSARASTGQTPAGGLPSWASRPGALSSMPSHMSSLTQFDEGDIFSLGSPINLNSTNDTPLSRSVSTDSDSALPERTTLSGGTRVGGSRSSVPLSSTPLSMISMSSTFIEHTQPLPTLPECVSAKLLGGLSGQRMLTALPRPPPVLGLEVGPFMQVADATVRLVHSLLASHAPTLLAHAASGVASVSGLALGQRLFVASNKLLPAPPLALLHLLVDGSVRQRIDSNRVYTHRVVRWHSQFCVDHVIFQGTAATPPRRKARDAKATPARVRYLDAPLLHHHRLIADPLAPANSSSAAQPPAVLVMNVSVVTDSIPPFSRLNRIAALDYVDAYLLRPVLKPRAQAQDAAAPHSSQTVVFTSVTHMQVLARGLVAPSAPPPGAADAKPTDAALSVSGGSTSSAALGPREHVASTCAAAVENLSQLVCATGVRTLASEWRRHVAAAQTASASPSDGTLTPPLATSASDASPSALGGMRTSASSSALVAASPQYASQNAFPRLPMVAALSSALGLARLAAPALLASALADGEEADMRGTSGGGGTSLRSAPLSASDLALTQSPVLSGSAPFRLAEQPLFHTLVTSDKTSYAAAFTACDSLIAHTRAVVSADRKRRLSCRPTRAFFGLAAAVASVVLGVSFHFLTEPWEALTASAFAFSVVMAAIGVLRVARKLLFQPPASDASNSYDGVQFLSPRAHLFRRVPVDALQASLVPGAHELVRKRTASDGGLPPQRITLVIECPVHPAAALILQSSDHHHVLAPIGLPSILAKAAGLALLSVVQSSSPAHADAADAAATSAAAAAAAAVAPERTLTRLQEIASMPLDAAILLPSLPSAASAAHVPAAAEGAPKLSSTSAEAGYLVTTIANVVDASALDMGLTILAHLRASAMASKGSRGSGEGAPAAAALFASIPSLHEPAITVYSAVDADMPCISVAETRDAHAPKLGSGSSGGSSMVTELRATLTDAMIASSYPERRAVVQAPIIVSIVGVHESSATAGDTHSATATAVLPSPGSSASMDLHASACRGVTASVQLSLDASVFSLQAAAAFTREFTNVMQSPATIFTFRDLPSRATP